MDDRIRSIDIGMIQCTCTIIGKWYIKNHHTDKGNKLKVIVTECHKTDVAVVTMEVEAGEWKNLMLEQPGHFFINCEVEGAEKFRIWYSLYPKR